MRPPHRLRSAAALLAATTLALTGCRDATAPADVSGTYALQRLGTEALPASLGGTAGAGFTALVAETLRLDAEGTAHLESQRHHGAGYAGNYNPADAFDFTVVGDGTWQRRGDTVVVSLAYTGDRDPFGSASYTGTLRLRPASGGLSEYQNPLSSTTLVRSYAR